MSGRPDFKGDYMGFTYGTKADGTPMHSSDLGIVRVSDGSRFNENLLPTIQDKTVQVPGGDGAYYFGSYYTQRQFSVSFAFDGLTELQVATLKAHFGDKQIHDLIFDETPYKVYKAKVTGTATLKYLAFDEGENHRLYKGEGSLQFTCYYPFARCRFTTREEYKDIGCTNIDEWWEATRIIDGKNFGDVPTPLELDIKGKGQVTINGKTIKWEIPDGVTATINTRNGTVKVKDSTNSSYQKGDLLNRYVLGDLTVKLPVNANAPDTDNNLTEVRFTCLYI